MDPETDWMVTGDFNLIRKVEDRNRPGGDISDMFRFNAAISQLGLNEIMLQAEGSLGLTCSNLPCWRNWTGFSHPAIRESLFHLLVSKL